MENSLFIVAVATALVVVVLLAKTAVVGPQQKAFIVEYLGKYSRTLHAGFHILVPFLERASINSNVVSELDKASESWGVKVLRYEIKNIKPPVDVIAAMEKQMRAEREKRAVILTSEGNRDAKINEADGEKERVIKESEAAKQRQINEAQGEAILAIADATAEGLRRVGVSLSGQGGEAAMQLRIAEQYVEQFGALAREANTLVIPANLSDVSSMIALATKVAKSSGSAQAPAISS